MSLQRLGVSNERATATLTAPAAEAATAAATAAPTASTTTSAAASASRRAKESTDQSREKAGAPVTYMSHPQTSHAAPFLARETRGTSPSPELLQQRQFAAEEIGRDGGPLTTGRSSFVLKRLAAGASGSRCCLGRSRDAQALLIA
ncbi:hypothetical protein Emed_007192 [Eimeria media]